MTARQHPARPPRDRLHGAAAAKLHATLAAGVALGGTACGLEVWRALGGHTLSWLYVFEWPLLIGCGVWMWWQLLHDTRPRPAIARRPDGGAEPAPGTVGSVGEVAAGGAAGGVGDVAALRAWQAYLRQMELDEMRDPDYRT